MTEFICEIFTSGKKDELSLKIENRLSEIFAEHAQDFIIRIEKVEYNCTSTQDFDFFSVFILISLKMK